MKGFLLLFASVICVSCARSAVDRRLDSAERFMDSSPDSALIIIESIPKEDLRSASQEARYALLKSIALEKNYIEVKSDTLIRRALEYYTTNDVSLEYRMLSFYYYGIVQRYAGNSPSAIAYLERAQRLAEQLNDNYYQGLIHRNKGAIYNSMANHRQAIDNIRLAITSFQKAGKELHAEYAQLSLAIAYFNNRSYKEAVELLTKLDDPAHEISNRYYSRLLLGDIGIIQKNPPEEAIQYFRSVPLEIFDIRDFAYRGLAFERLSQPDSADYWFHKAYSLAIDAADTAIVDNMRSDVEFMRGNYLTAYRLVDNAMRQQDKYIRAHGLDVLDMALKEYYQDELALEKAARERQRERLLWLGVLAIFLAIICLGYLLYRLRKKDRALEDQMAKFSAAESEHRELQKENVSLIGALFSERLQHLDLLSRKYFTADEKEQKEIVFASFKKNLVNLRSDETVYQSMRQDLDRYQNGIYTRFLNQVPGFKEDSLQIITLFFAGVPYETIELLTRRSKAALKSFRSRLRSAIKEAGAPDADRFLDALEIRK